MTVRLYYDDPYSRHFAARVERAEPRDNRLALWLDRTSFYPTSGGQPFDTGTIGDGRVVDVADENGDVVHLIEPNGTVAVGDSVRGEIDWRRRFDHMQQHTGQHVLSAAIVRLFSVPTVSFHLGEQASTIDVDRELTPTEIAAATAEANRVVWENRPVQIRYADADDAAGLGLRKASARSGTLRLIDIDDYDLSACGGTHVRQTGAIGIIEIASWERFRGGHRLEFLCGGRVSARFAQLRDSVAGSARLLSALPAEIPAVIERLQQEGRENKKQLSALQTELATHRAEAMVASAESVGGFRLSLNVLDGDANLLKTIATAITAKPGHVAVLVSASTPALVVAARSKETPCDCQALVKALLGKFGGRGGGKPDLAQAGGLAAPPVSIVDEARRWLAAL